MIMKNRVLLLKEYLQENSDEKHLRKTAEIRKYKPTTCSWLSRKWDVSEIQILTDAMSEQNNRKESGTER